MVASVPVAAVTGLLSEGRIAAAQGIVTLAGGGDSARLASMLQAALATGVRAVISFGIAGGLQPDLAAGTVIVGCSVRHGTERFVADPGWVARLQGALPAAVLGDLVGADRAICAVEEKRALRAATGAAAVDMESHVVARLAALNGVPFAALRVVSDPHDRALPRAAIVGMRSDGSADVGAVLRALRRDPQALPGLIQAALDARTALAALRRSRRRLTPTFHFDGSSSAARDGTKPAVASPPLSNLDTAIFEAPAESA